MLLSRQESGIAVRPDGKVQTCRKPNPFFLSVTFNRFRNLRKLKIAYRLNTLAMCLSRPHEVWPGRSCVSRIGQRRYHGLSVFSRGAAACPRRGPSSPKSKTPTRRSATSFPPGGNTPQPPPPCSPVMPASCPCGSAPVPRPSSPRSDRRCWGSAVAHTGRAAGGAEGGAACRAACVRRGRRREAQPPAAYRPPATSSAPSWFTPSPRSSVAAPPPSSGR